MNTSVNSETWIRVGSRMPSTPSEPLASMNAVSAIAAMNSTIACRTVAATIKAHATNATHITRPNHVALSMIARDQRDGRKAERDAAPGQEILAVVQPGDFGRVVRRAEHHIGKQQQFERHQIGQRQRRQHQPEVSRIGDTHAGAPQYLRDAVSMTPIRRQSTVYPASSGTTHSAGSPRATRCTLSNALRKRAT